MSALADMSRLPVDLPVFIKRFAEGYTSPNLSRLRKIIGVAASHHRLAWIHPFLDGNGRVARLFSHASNESLAQDTRAP